MSQKNKTRLFPWRTHFCRPVLTLSCDNYSFDHLHPYVTHIFGKLSPCSFWWYYPWKKFLHKNVEEGGLQQKTPFSIIFRVLSKVKNCYSDNFDASGLAHGSFEALWAKFKWEHWKSGTNSQNWGPSPLWSQPIQDRVPPKSCF